MGEAAYDLIGIDRARGVCELGHAPDTLDGGVIVYVFLDQVHIRPVFLHRNIDHLDIEGLRNLEVAVIPGHRAEELDLGQAAPGGASADAEEHGPGYRIVHDIEGRISEYEDVLRLVLHHGSHEGPCFRNADGFAVVPTVAPVLADQVRLTMQDIQHGHGQLQLLDRRLAPGHVQRKAPLLILAVGLFQTLLLVEQLFLRHFRVLLHFLLLSLQGLRVPT